MKKLIFNMLILTLISSIVAAGCACTATQRLEEYWEEYTKTIALSGETKLILKNTNGVIDITGSDSTNEMLLKITKRVKNNNLEDAEEHIDDIVITEEKRPQEVYIKVEHPISEDRNYAVDFSITLPSHFDFQITSGNGNIYLSSIIGNLALAMGNGNIELNSVNSTQIDVELGNGDIDADINLVDSCMASLRVGNGKITLKVPKNTNAKVDASSGIGNVTYTDLDFKNLQVSSSHLEGVLGEGKGDVVLTVGSGDIELTGK